MQITWKNCFKIIISALILYLGIAYSKNVLGFVVMLLSAALPLFVGGAVAYVVNLVMAFYERHLFTKCKGRYAHNLRTFACMVGAFITIAAIVAAVIWLIVPQLVECFKLISAYVPVAANFIVEKVDDFNVVPKDILRFISGMKLETYLGDIFKFFASGAGSVVEIIYKAVISVFTGVATAFVSIIFAVYLLLSKDRLKGQISRTMKRYLPIKYVKKINYVSSTVNESFHRYIVAQCTEAFILGVLCTLGMYILRLPYAPMIGALVGFTAVVPIVGAFIGAAIGAFMILTVSPLEALVFIVFIIILQQLEENLIYPRVVGSSVNLPGIWVLAAITVGGGVLGIIGMLIAVPIVASIYRIVREDVSRHEEMQIKKETEEV